MNLKSKIPNSKLKIEKILIALLRAVLIVSIGYVLINPLFQILSNSLKTNGDVLDTSVVWIPKHFDVSNYINAVDIVKYFSSLLNTLKVQILSGGIEIITCAVVAYGFARFPAPEKKIYYAVLLLMVIVPIQLIMLPNYLNYRFFDFFGLLKLVSKITGKNIYINLINTSSTFLLPSLFAVGYRSGIFILIYIQFFKGLPKELEEAAWVDGAGPFRTFVKVILPSSGVAILTVGILSVIWHWNEYYLSSTYFNGNYSLAVQLSRIKDTLQQAYLRIDVNSGLQISMAACVLYILPILVFYLIFQRKFIKSIDRVGIVG